MADVTRAIAMVAGSINVAVNTQQAISDPTRLRNPLDAPMWLDSIVITPPLGSSGGPLGTTSNYLCNLLCRIYIGREQLTNGFVPVVTLDRTLNVSRAIAITSVNYVVDYGSYNYIWKFKKPLWVPRGGYVRMELWNTGATFRGNNSPNDYTGITVTYRGRSLPQDYVPATVDLPWNTSFVSPVQTVEVSTTISASTQSKETDLVNPYEQPFKVTRMVGILNINDTPNGVSAGNQMLYANQALVRITDSQGGIIVRDPTPFGNLFQPIDNSWPMHSTVVPHNYYIVNADLSYANAFNVGTDRVQLLMALSGYRTVPTEQAQLV